MGCKIVPFYQYARSSVLEAVIRAIESDHLSVYIPEIESEWLVSVAQSSDFSVGQAVRLSFESLYRSEELVGMRWLEVEVIEMEFKELTKGRE